MSYENAGSDKSDDIGVDDEDSPNFADWETLAKSLLDFDTALKAHGSSIVDLLKHVSKSSIGVSV